MAETRTLPVPDGLDGDRVDAGLSRMLGLSRSVVAALAADGAIRVDGRTAGKSDRLVAGGWVEVDLPDPRGPVELVAEQVEGLRVVHDDDDIVVVDKPVGVAAHPSPGWSGPTVIGGLAGVGYRISTSGAAERQGVVHRLDVGTSGLMVVAKSEHAYSALKRAFKERTVEKVYHAVVQGLPDPVSGTIDAPIGRHPSSDWKWAVTTAGKPSTTHYELLEAFRSASLVEVHLETGRTHQIRVHFSALRHPCVGDLTYGADPDPVGAARPLPAVAARPPARLRAPRHRAARGVLQRLPGRPRHRAGAPARAVTWRADRRAGPVGTRRGTRRGDLRPGHRSAEPSVARPRLISSATATGPSSRRCGPSPVVRRRARTRRPPDHAVRLVPAVRPPAQPHRVLDARRCGAGRRPVRGGRADGDAGAGHHRPRLRLRGVRVLEAVPQARREADHRRRGLRHPRHAPHRPHPGHLRRRRPRRRLLARPVHAHDAAGRERRGHAQPVPDVVAGQPRRRLRQVPAARPRAAPDLQRRPDRHHGLRQRRGADPAAPGPVRQGARGRGRPARHLRGRATTSPR